MITSTITNCKAKAIIINTHEPVKTFRNKEDNSLVSVGAFEKEFSLFGEYSESGFADAVRKAIAREDKELVFVGITNKSFKKSSVRMAMEEERFVELAHLVAEKESRLALITRTISSFEVSYKVVKEDETFEERTFVSKTNDKKRLLRLLDIECQKDNSVMFKILAIKEISGLYGIERSVFAKYANELMS